MITHPESCKIVVGAVNLATSSLTTGVADLVCLKNVHRATIFVAIDCAAGGATVLQPERATDVAGTGLVDIATVVQIWINEDIATSDTLVRQTDATSVTLTGDTNDKLVVFQINPATLITNTAGSAPTFFDCLGIYDSSGGESTDKATVIYELWERYQQATPPSAIID